jgi:lysophospholipase L1-like esterase
MGSGMKTSHAFRRSSRLLHSGILALGAVTCGLSLCARAPAAPPEASGPRCLLEKGDRVAWIGSSSTRIGVWPRTVEFLLRTRHPDLDLRFRRFTTGAGTFATGLEHLDEWLDDFRPTVVFFNYGGNDAAAGPEGLPGFKDIMEGCVAKARARGARVVLITPQAADVRKSGALAAARRTLYAETMLAHGRGRGWTVLDIHHPLDAMQKANERDDPSYTILKDTIHLTDAAYVGWGFLLYDRLELPFVRGAATLEAGGRVTATEGCSIQDVETGPDLLSFTRLDEVLPILPPGPLPPRLSAPLEAHSRYLLTVTGLDPGEYEIRCDGRPIGVADAAALAVGVNLNSLLLDGGREAPWAELSQSIWDGRMPEGIGPTRWRFEVRKL